MIKYVAGFLFDRARARVALVKKTSGPPAVVGHWNAIGGKRESILNLDENSLTAMQREFLEETGVLVEDWKLFLILKGNNNGEPWVVDFFHAFDTDKLLAVRTMEEEEIRIHSLDWLPNTVPNLDWIIPMALGHQNDHVSLYEVREAVCS